VSRARVPSWKVVAEAEGNPPFEATVDAADEWKARTRAMLNYPHRLRGQTVAFEVTPI
jgi:hypothetical protein